MRVHAVCWISASLLVLAAGREQAQGRRAARGEKGTMEPTLDWKLRRDGATLKLDYTVDNTTDEPIYLVDDMLMWGKTRFRRAPEAIIVRNGDQPGRVSLFRGMMYIPSRDERQYPAPGLRRVEPRAQASGSAQVSLPVKAWHNYHPGKIEPLKGTPGEVVLEIQYLTSKGTLDRDYAVKTLEDGSQIESPYVRHLNESGKVLRSRPQALP
jgi:hypothetical protein